MIATNTFLYQRGHPYFASLGGGLEEWGAGELKAVGATEIKAGYRGFHFQASPAVLYRMLYTTRLFSRVVAPLTLFDCHSPKYLYRRAYELPWEELMRLDQTFAVQAVTVHSAMHHSRYAALSLKDAIVDRFRDRTGSRPNVDPKTPDVSLHLYIERNQAVISLDLAGGSLHRRGYRMDAIEAPMQETVAAGMIAASGWEGNRCLVDPFCGSGTILCEAWMRACRIPAGYLRSTLGLFQLPDFDPALWARMKAEQDACIEHPARLELVGSDSDPAAVRAAKGNLARLPEGKRVTVEVADFRQLDGWSEALMVTNPPYGIRLGSADMAGQLLKEFGDFLKQRCAGSQAYVFYGDEQLVKKLGLKPSQKWAVRNGGLDGRLCSYDLFAGAARPSR
jgi:putative N6-adenine-specific DNA methylase